MMGKKKLNKKRHDMKGIQRMKRREVSHEQTIEYMKMLMCKYGCDHE